VLEVGGFRVGLWPGEDVDLDIRLAAAGAVFYFVPDALVHHHRPGTLPWFRRMMRRYGAAERELVALHGRTRRIDYVPALTTMVAGGHLLYAVPACRAWVAAVDVAAVVLGAVVLVVTTPPRHWLAVTRFGAVAFWEWHRGWWSARERRSVHDRRSDRGRGGRPTTGAGRAATVAPNTADDMPRQAAPGNEAP
jgi:cellulose synthase/poly-beta-1,6-N-acetylglucosamine synthase-like glycosyltransferase